MIKVEMLRTAPEGRVKEYIWLLGQSWPVMESDDSQIARVEAFGGELADALQNGGSTTGTPVPDSKGVEVCRTWYMIDAQNVSKQMRRAHP